MTDRDAVTRVLVVSADMGEGHNATGRALAEAARELWPGCTVDWLDTLAVMGRGVGPTFRRIYVTNVETTPWLYEFFYAGLWRHRWFADASKAFVGSWSGRRLAPHLHRLRPDVILSTYPLGSAGLAWLRRRGRVPQPVGAWVSDFAPHPFWVYAELDRTFVMHELAAALGRKADPAAQVRVCPPPVVRAFRDAGEADGGQVRARTRARLGVADDARLVLVSCGAFGFGSVPAAVAAVLDAAPDVIALVVCGRNRRLRDSLAALPVDRSRLRVFGWVDDIPALLAASDLVVSNAGGATALEALAAGRPILMFQPIAAHGRANARLMALAGAAQTCATPGELTLAVRRQQPLREQRHAAQPGVRGALEELTGQPVRPAGYRLAAGDALFLDIDTPQVPQQIGAVIVVEPGDRGPLTRELVLDWAAAIPGVAGRLRPGGAWRGARWTPLPEHSIEGIVSSCDLSPTEQLTAAVDRFFGQRLDLSGPAARVRLVSGLPDGRQAVLVQTHHALCDGVALTQALVARAGAGTPGAGAGAVPPTVRPTVRSLAPDPAVPGGLRLVRALWSLVRAGPAPRTGLDAPILDASRRHLLIDLPADDVRRAARRHAASRGELLIALLAEATSLTVPGLAVVGARVRVMVPRSLRRPDADADAEGCGGNRTGATPVDIPLEPMPLSRRVTLTRTALRRQTCSDQPLAAREVLRLIGALPPLVRRRANALVYRSAWFGAIATVLPRIGPGAHFYGRRITQVYPVLPLAPGVNLAFGAIPRPELVSVCVTLGPALAPHGSALSSAVRAALGEALHAPERSSRSVPA